MSPVTKQHTADQESWGASLKPVIPALAMAATPPFALSVMVMVFNEPMSPLGAMGGLAITAVAAAFAITKLAVDLREKDQYAELLSRQLLTSKKQGLRFASWHKSMGEMTPDWYWEMDRNFRFVVFEGKKAFENGFVSDKMIGLSPWEMPASNLTKEDWVIHRATLNQHQSFHDFVIGRMGPGGEPYWISVSGRPLVGERSTFTGYAGICRVITDLKVATQKIDSLALEDELTGLANRRLLLSRLPQAVSLARRSKRRVALLLVSLDGFKRVNEMHGNQIGDVVIREVATRLQGGVRASDLVARYNGDVFAVVLEEVVGDDGAIYGDVAKLAEKLARLVQAPVTFLSTEIICSVCIGLAVAAPHAQSVQPLISEAENALAKAKRDGGACIRLSRPEHVAALGLDVPPSGHESPVVPPAHP